MNVQALSNKTKKLVFANSSLCMQIRVDVILLSQQDYHLFKPFIRHNQFAHGHVN